MRVPRQRSAERYLAMLEAEGRDEWQRPAKVVEALGIRPGMRVADIGTGSGYFLPLLDEAVGARGLVTAQDIDAELLAAVRRRIASEGLHRVQTLRGQPDDPGLGAQSYHVILMVDVYHHIRNGPAFLDHLRQALQAGGRLFVLDFPPDNGIPEQVAGQEHRIDRGRVIADARLAGLWLIREHRVPRYQFMLEFGVERDRK